MRDAIDSISDELESLNQEHCDNEVVQQLNVWMNKHTSRVEDPVIGEPTQKTTFCSQDDRLFNNPEFLSELDRIMENATTMCRTKTTSKQHQQQPPSQNIKEMFRLIPTQTQDERAHEERADEMTEQRTPEQPMPPVPPILPSPDVPLPEERNLATHGEEQTALECDTTGQEQANMGVQKESGEIPKTQHSKR